MKMEVGFALCGSFCCLESVMEVLEHMVETMNITPIVSYNVISTTTRYYEHEKLREDLVRITGNQIIDTIEKAEPIGPKKLFDLLVVAPCTGNTLGKLANGICDTPVTMAVKAHLRNDRPVVLAPATNDGLSASAANIGTLLVRKNIFLVPMVQDDVKNKPFSLIADFKAIPLAITAAMEGKQLRPVYL